MAPVQAVARPLVALCAGAKSLAETEALTKEMSTAMRRQLKIPRRVPDTTLRHTLLRVEPNELRACLYRQVRAAHRRKALSPHDLPLGLVAIDGKTTAIDAWDDTYAQRQRHSNGPSESGMVRTLTVCLASAEAKPCLDAHPIPSSTNEMGAFESALNALCAAYGRLNLFQMVSVDAGMCSLKNGELIRKRGLHYLFGLKSDQPTLLAQAQRLLAGCAAADAQCETEDVLSNNTIVLRRLSAAVRWQDSSTGTTSAPSCAFNPKRASCDAIQ